MAGYTVTGEKCMETSFSLYLFKQLYQVCVLVLDACMCRQGCKWYGYFPTVFEFDPVCNGFYPSVSDSEYPLFITNPHPSAQKLHFYDVNIHYNLIRQKLTLFVSDSVFEHKYENKYDISDIRPYPIRFHPRSPHQYKLSNKLHSNVGAMEEQGKNKYEDTPNALDSRKKTASCNSTLMI